jgi:hypothetical protein
MAHGRKGLDSSEEGRPPALPPLRTSLYALLLLFISAVARTNMPCVINSLRS